MPRHRTSSVGPRDLRTVVGGAVAVGLLAAAFAVADVVGLAGGATLSSGAEGLLLPPLATASAEGGATPGTDGAPAARGTTSGALDPELAKRVQDAVAAAAQDGVTLTVTSGARTPEQQQRLVDEAVARHGSLEEAQRWVLPPEASAHVAGTAVDVGPAEGAAWLGEHGEALGLCRTYANEPWHFELVGPVGEPCPPVLADASGGW